MQYINDRKLINKKFCGNSLRKPKIMLNRIENNKNQDIYEDDPELVIEDEDALEDIKDK